MKPALREKKPLYPESWQAIPAGEALKVNIDQILMHSSRRFFGYHLVNIGCLSSTLRLPECAIKHRVDIVTDASMSQSGASVVIAKSKSLPLLENSVDTVVLAHELDYSQDPHQVLREADRVLIPNGNLVIVGFNPLSFAGISRFLPISSMRYLREASFFSSMRVNDWLHLLGFEIIEQHQMAYSSLMISQKWKLMGRIDQIFRQYLPIFSSVYIIVAKKRVLPLSLIKPKWKPSPKFSPVGASMRDSSGKC